MQNNYNKFFSVLVALTLEAFISCGVKIVYSCCKSYDGPEIAFKTRRNGWFGARLVRSAILVCEISLTCVFSSVHFLVLSHIAASFAACSRQSFLVAVRASGSVFSELCAKPLSGYVFILAGSLKESSRRKD